MLCSEQVQPLLVTGYALVTLTLPSAAEATQVNNPDQQPDAQVLLGKMGHQARAASSALPLPLLRLQLRLRANLRHCYPSFASRQLLNRPLALLSIVFVLSIIATGVYLVLLQTLLPELRTRREAPLLALFFSWCIVCTLLSYLLTAVAHPGKVPDAWRPLSFQMECVDAPGVSVVQPGAPPDTQLYPVAPAVVHASHTSMLRADGRYRYCNVCKIFKPDRAHHCSSCNECILLMDHHCPFTGNSCIGFQNRKFFLLFLYYATLSCVQVAVLTPRTIYKRLSELDDKAATEDMLRIIGMMFGYIICTVHAMALWAFSAFHTYLALKNRTTIENQESRPTLHGDVLRRCDKGWLGNWNAIFGPRPLLWFVPVSYGREGDACQWVNRMDDVL